VLITIFVYDAKPVGAGLPAMTAVFQQNIIRQNKAPAITDRGFLLYRD
jgi:hypothetical protein